MSKLGGSAANVFSILIVDDDEDDRALLIQAFKKCGATGIKSARDGAEALDTLRRCKEILMPKLVLLDINLPKLRGTEVLREIRATPRTRRLPVVMLSGSAAEKDIAECYDSGANGYVVKPSEWGVLEKLACKLSAFWLEVNQPPPLEPA